MNIFPRCILDIFHCFANCGKRQLWWENETVLDKRKDNKRKEIDKKCYPLVNDSDVVTNLSWNLITFAFNITSTKCLL